MTDEQKKQQEEVQTPPAPAPSVTEMEQAHAEELAGLQQSNQQRYTDIGDIISEAETKLGALKQKDEAAQKRSNAFRYIAGLGDILSGIANLVGTAYGAQNQQQVYNSNMVSEKAEQSRKERKLELDQITGRIDEMRARQKDLRASGSLAEAQLKAKQARELATEKNRIAAIEREEAWKKKQQEWREEEAARAQENWQKTFDEGVRQFDETNKRLANAAKDENESREKTKQMELDAKAQQEAIKRASDPKHQAKVLQQNITGIRDELAASMGYKDYNEYLQYNSEKVKGWGKDIDGVRNRISRDIRDERNERYPETVALLDTLTRPEDLTEEQVRMLISASSVFADAVGKGAITNDDTAGGEEDDEFDQYIRR